MKPALALIVCGGRDYSDSRAVYAALDRIASTRGVRLIRHGGAAGADRLAASWAEFRGVEAIEYTADWERYGRRAGPMRNAVMAEAGADGLVAFPGGPGTADMIRQAERCGIPVWRPV